MKFEETYERWRKMLLRTNIHIALVVFTVELLMYFVLKRSDLITQSETLYLINFLIVPTVADFVIIVSGQFIIKRLSSDSNLINYVPSIQLSFICFVVASTHFIFSVTLCIFCVPLFSSVIFGNRKMLRHMGILCCFFLFFTLLHRKFSPYRLIDDRYFWEEAIIALVILITTEIICSVFIKFQEEKNNTIYQDYLIKLEMQDQLNKDPKTGLYGYTIFMNTLDRMVKLAESTNKAIALAIIDIDNFKQINDTYGHLKGDQVILALAELMKLNTNANLFLARYGGEEFTIILSEGEVENAFDLLENLRIEFEKKQYNFTDRIITISIGIAIWKPGWNSEMLFDKADVAMYASKAKGKNTVMIFT